MVSSKFDSLSVRPPTPPKDLQDLPDQDLPDDKDADVDETLQFLQDPFGELPPCNPQVAAAKRVNTPNTPEQSPSSDPSLPPSSSARKKRVLFELCSSPTKPGAVKTWTPSRSSPLRPLPQTRVFRPLKSILKPSDAASTPPPADETAAAHHFKTFADMLESIVKQLAQGERPPRLDAYHSLQRTMQAYDNIPDEQALKNKLPLLTQFIQRDLVAQSTTGTGIDSQLTTQALKLLLVLLRLPDLVVAMEDEFCAFVVDRSIQVASDATIPKTVVNTHLAVLMQQNFRPKIVTPHRVEKMLDALDTVHERVKGFSVQAYRLRIYKKLTQQRPDLMSKHADQWFKHAFRSLISFHKDISQSALETTLCAAKTTGQDRHITRAALTLLNRAKSDGKTTIAQVLTAELEKMLQAENAVMVPQVWAAVTALLRNNMSHNLFTGVTDWVRIFERCLTHEKEQVRVGASVAFNFLVYSVNPAHNMLDLWTSMFFKITSGGMSYLLSQKQIKRYERDAIYSRYYGLLYYALRPTAPSEQLDRFWNEFVAGIWRPVIHKSSTQAAEACRVVTALLEGSANPWNEQRALDFRYQAMVQRADLPRLDPKWVRRSLPSILLWVETLLDATPWSEKEQQEEQPAKAMWLALVNSVVEAGRMEVMASSESKGAMAQIVNLLRRVWDRHTGEIALSQTKEDSWADKFCFLVETVVQRLKPTQFAEKSLTRNGEDEFEVASTPSHRGRQQMTSVSPLLYFVDLLVNRSEGKLPDAVRLRALKLIIEPCFDVQNTRMGRLEMLRDCSAAVDGSSRAAVAQSFWMQIASLLKTSLQAQVPDTNERVSRQLGKEYEVVVSLLKLCSGYFLNSQRGLEVLDAFINTVRREAGDVRREAGDGAVVLAVVEPVSEHVIKQTPEESKTSCQPYTSTLLRNLPSKSITRRALDAGREKLGPVSSTSGKSADFDPYNHLYGAVVSVGSAAYRGFTGEDTKSTQQFLEALRMSIRNCSISLLAVYLRKVKDVIQVWVVDSDRKLQNREPSSKVLHREVVNLWKDVNEAIERLPRKDSQVLKHLETLILAGFSSRRRTIVNVSIDSWNKTFGKEQSLRYPPDIENTLRRFASTVELSLPSLILNEDETADELSFYDSDNTPEDMPRAFKSPRVKESPFKMSRSARKKNQSPAVASPASRRKSARGTPKIRLRHDNSQIQFEPIISSPTNPFNQESQLLTERQKEMYQRQRSNTQDQNLHPWLQGPPSPQHNGGRSPLEIHSDAPSVDELPKRRPRATPKKTLESLGPMDTFLGSSPTPHARRRSQKVASDATELTTPTAVRNVNIGEDENIGSSPPQFGKVREQESQPKDAAQESVEYEQPGSSFAESFNDTTLDEGAFPALSEHAQQDRAGSNVSGDTIMSGSANQTDELQLTAQIDADMQAADTSHSFDQGIPESVEKFVNVASQQVPSSLLEGSETEIETPRPSRTKRGVKKKSSSTSRVGDSFESPSQVRDSPRSQELRRSSRHSLGSPVQSPGEQKRRNTPKGKRKAETEEIQKKHTQLETASKSQEVENTASQQTSHNSKKRKTRNSLGSPQTTVDNQVSTTSETGRTRGPIRLQSRLKQVENAEDVIVEDTPAPKRARQTGATDVSEAKQMTRTVLAEESTAFDSAAATNMSEELTPSRSFTERVILTPRSIINKLKEFKDYFLSPGLVLGRAEEREIDDALFDIRRQMHAAGMRGESRGQGEE